MVHYFIELIQHVLLPLGGVGVFLASILEEVVAPIPSAIVQATAGFVFMAGRAFSLASFGRLTTFVILPSALGVALGSLPVYFLARLSGKPAIDRWGKWLAFSWDDVERAERYLKQGHRRTGIMFFLRTIPLVPSVVMNALCGVVRVPLPEYLVVTFLGAGIRAGILGFIGWQAGSLYETYADYIGRFENIGLVVLVLGGAVFISARLWRKKKGNSTLDTHI